MERMKTRVGSRVPDDGSPPCPQEIERRPHGDGRLVDSEQSKRLDRPATPCPSRANDGPKDEPCTAREPYGPAPAGGIVGGVGARPRRVTAPGRSVMARDGADVRSPTRPLPKRTSKPHEEEQNLEQVPRDIRRAWDRGQERCELQTSVSRPARSAPAAPSASRSGLYTVTSSPTHRLSPRAMASTSVSSSGASPPGRR